MTLSMRRRSCMTEHDPNEIQLVASLTAKPGQETALRTALQSIIPEVLRERGCVEYAMHVDRKTPSRVVMFERWADQEALDSHGPVFHFNRSRRSSIRCSQSRWKSSSCNESAD